MGGNVQNEKQSEGKGGLAVNGSAYVNCLSAEKPVLHEPVSPRVVLKAAATTNTTPPDRSRATSGDLATPSPPPLQYEHHSLIHPGRASRNLEQLTGQTIYKSRTSAEDEKRTRVKSQETAKRKLAHPRVTIKASEPKKERELGEVHKLLQHHSMVRNQHVMDSIVKHKKEKKGLLYNSQKVKDYVNIVQEHHAVEDAEKNGSDVDDDVGGAQAQGALQPEASLAAESLAMD
jgi:hypothetical protein